MTIVAKPDAGGLAASARASNRPNLATANGARCMSKPKKTTLQLEMLIKEGAAKTISLPKNLVVSVWPDADVWKVVCHSPNPREDKECFELIRKEADRLKLQFDLHL
jgi:hypothetical protein